MRRSLRLKVALVFSALTIVLLVAQAFGVRVLAEGQEERLIDALIHDDMVSVLRRYHADETLLPPFDAALGGYVSAAYRQPIEIRLPAYVGRLSNGIHEIILGGQEIHVAIVPFESTRLYRVYDFSAYEQHFKAVINALMAGTGVFALLTIWLAFGLSALLVRQVAGLARQVKLLRHAGSAPINPGKYDEEELVDLVYAFNDYHTRMEDAIDREKEFTSHVSHELRTPLTTIKTSCELLEQDPAIAGKSRARLGQIDRAADGMRELVDALLLLAREESAMHLEPVALARLVEDALQPFEDTLRAKDLASVVDIDDTVTVYANSAALAIVLSNLIDNAVRYTSEGKIRVAWEGGRLLVEDTGCGIAEQALPHVFERFYRGGEPASDVHGFGLGLAIVRKIGERYGWEVSIESETGRGTRLWLRLPVSGNGRSESPDGKGTGERAS
ncbi:two-component sensor histidine kinase [Trinickia symbiotica]|uniref:histidine kinase n=1 Tax=Trinickia symbiotica TaxID=863227 RepID=A0A2T3XUF3_9BURK|nr:HAMP domain-containing sensor histidine kinase [Trinickia symbiotica]PTB20125.1 two-component sensor histidine kinase [Trinickia symbiotica]